jgi:hypothetical protein
MEVTPVTEYINNCIQNLLQHVKRMDRVRIPHKCFDMPHWTTIARKTEEEMVGGCNRPLGLMLE